MATLGAVFGVLFTAPQHVDLAALGLLYTPSFNSFEPPVILAGGLAFIFTWGLLASIYFHRPWRCQQQLPRLPGHKCHAL